MSTSSPYDPLSPQDFSGQTTPLGLKLTLGFSTTLFERRWSSPVGGQRESIETVILKYRSYFARLDLYLVSVLIAIERPDIPYI